MRINTNLTAMNTYTQYTKNNNKIASAVEKLSSGYAINSAADNAAGLAISEKMRAQIHGLEKASTNSQDAISLVQTAEGSLSESTEILQRMREIAVQSSSDTNENEIDRTALQDEFSQLQSELNDIASNTTFNKKNLLDGSLASSTKNLTNTNLKNSGMTVDLGNVATGTYNFSVSTKLESAAVDGKKPTSYELVTDGADSYFDNSSVTNSVSLGSNVEESDLLNGNYTLSATYGDDGCITVTATGDNGQTFDATINQSTLESLSSASGSSLKVDMTFNAAADDAFKVTVGLSGNIAPTESNYNTLAESLSKLTVSVSGGVTAKEAEYGVYANLTGAESIKLEAGMDSVSFSNGVKVNFDKLTASSVDTENKASVTNATAIAAPSAAATLAAFGGAGATTLGGVTVSAGSLSNFGGSSVIADGAYSITSDTSGVLTLKDADGKTYTAAAKSTTAASTAQSVTYTFVSDTDPSKTFNADLALTLSANTGTAAAINFSGTMRGINGVSLTGESAGTASMSNFSFTDDSTVTNGALAIKSSTAAGVTTFTATDTAGNEYTATIDAASLLSSDAFGTTSNTLTFEGSSGTVGFTATLDTVNGDAASGATATAFTDGAQLTATIDDAGHKYASTFGTVVSGDLSVTTASSFSVESTANKGLTFQVGANEGDDMTIYIDKMDANYLGVASASVATQSAASSAIADVDNAINQVSSQRAYLGAIQNRLDHKIANLNTSTENLTSAESQIRDVDMAKEMTNFTNANILQQAATAMLAQANSLPQNVLSLLK
ncbi:hypothetical protein SDC9_43588 [bioreactor metagenome]|uniref:Flagellin n=1 Tax=bioreactor metagenome TaxID=1076179 RepID=A0A644W1C8_9ZZZZ